MHFVKYMSIWQKKANLTSKKLQIVCPKQTDDLIAEGQALHHCVGTYIERVAAKKNV